MSEYVHFIRHSICAIGAALGVLTAACPLWGAPDASRASSVSEEKELSQLLIEGISLVNGEQGQELWRLSASWGSIAKNGDEVDLESPELRYILGDPNKKDYLYVSAKKGRITDKQQHVELWDEVRVRHGMEIVTGAALTYDSRTREIVFPKGGMIDSPTMTLRAEVLRWKLNENKLEAEQNVDAALKARPISPSS